jgi:hypothetical protein
MLRSAGTLGAVATLLLVLLATLPAAARAGGLPPEIELEGAGPDESRAADIVQEAYESVQERAPGCRYVDDPPSTSDAPVPDELAAALGIFRRPPTPEELALPRPLLVLGTFLPSSVRIVRTLPSGLRLVAFVEQIPFGTRRRPESCRVREARAVRRRLRGERPRVRRAALRQQRMAVREERVSVRLPPTSPMAWVHAVRPGEEVAEGLAGIKLQGLEGPPIVTAFPRGRRTVLLALVPDGVARVEVTTRRLDRTRPGVVWGREIVSSGRPVGNVVAIPVNRSHRVLFITDARWLAADGRVVSDIDCVEYVC